MKNKEILMWSGIVIVLAVLGYFVYGNSTVNHLIIFSSLIAFVVKLFLALLVYIKNPSAKTNKYFAMVFTGQAIWDLGKFFMWLTPNEETALIWAKISYTGYILSVFVLLMFVWTYLKKKNIFTEHKKLVYIPMWLLIASLWLSNVVIMDLHVSDGIDAGMWKYEYGPVYTYFFIWFQILPFIYAFSMFIYKYFKSHNPDKKKQLLFMVIGSAFPILIGIPTGVVMPALGIYLPPHNNMLSLVMSIFVAIGIIKYKFLAIVPIGERIIPGRKIDHAIAEEYKMDFGNSYYINNEKSSEIAHKVLLSHLYQKRFGLIITAHHPPKVRSDYGIETTPIVWITDTETEHPSVDPIDIEQLYETIERFVKMVPNAFVLIDGVHFLVQHNNFAKIHQFLKHVRIVIKENDACLMVAKGSLNLDPKQEKLLEHEFRVLPEQRSRKSSEDGRLATGSKKLNYIIIGHSDLSQSLMHELENQKIVPTVVDRKDLEHVYNKSTSHFFKGDYLNRKVLEMAGVNKPNTVVLLTLEKDAETILCINEIRQISDKVRVIANIHDSGFVNIAEKSGADKVIPSSSIGGKLIYLALEYPEIVKWVMDATTFSSKDIELTEMVVDHKSGFIGKSVIQADELIGTAGNIIAIKTTEGIKQIVEDDYVLKEGDGLVVVVNLEKICNGKQNKKVVACLMK